VPAKLLAGLVKISTVQPKTQPILGIFLSQSSKIAVSGSSKCTPVALFLSPVSNLAANDVSFARTARDSQLADDLHEVLHFSVQGRLADSQVLLHANASKEGHLCEYRWFHLGSLGFDISPDQIFEKTVALRNDFLRRAREHRELVHGIDRKAAFLTVPPENSVQPIAESYQRRIEDLTSLRFA
jgi:hypothetical protein